MSAHQKLSIIFESKVVQKLSLEKNVFTKKLSPKLIFLNSFKNGLDQYFKRLKFRRPHFMKL